MRSPNPKILLRWLANHSMKSMLNAANIRGPKFDGASAQRWLLAHGHLLKPVRSR
jgi:hypothetical protein